MDLGNAFLRSGELKSAETTFINCQALLEQIEYHQRTRSTVWIRMQLAKIKLLQGNYQNAFDRFSVLLNEMRHYLSKEERNVVKRLMTKSLLHQGGYQQAIQGFASLLNTIHERNPSNNTLAAEIPIRRDLALAYAYLGDHQQAISHISIARNSIEQLIRSVPIEIDATTLPKLSKATSEILGNQTTPSPDTETILDNYCAMRDHVLLAESRIHHAGGNLGQALEAAEKAPHGMRGRWGTTHLKTLECASQHSVLLALDSQIFAAAEACNLTHIETRRELGAQHPQTLGTLEHLVNVFLLQSRLVEAGDTARSLAETTKLLLTAKHPQTHRSIHLVAEAMLAVGDYASAEVQLECAIYYGTLVYGECHQDTLHYRSRLALAKYLQGKAQQAELLAVQVLREQCATYVVADSTMESPRITYTASANDQPSRTLADFQDALEVLLTKIGKDSAKSSVHPRLLQTLRVLALIARQNEDLKGLGSKALRTIWEQNKSSLSPSSIFTLNSEYDLALAHRENAEGSSTEESLDKAARHLRSVYRGRYFILGSTNADTISAKRELITTSCAIGHWEPSLELDEPDDTRCVTEKPCECDNGDHQLNDANWGRVLAESKKVVYQHEATVGKNHPETLKSLLWLLTVQVLLRQEKGAEETLCKALPRLRCDSTRNERFIESLNMEQKFALAIADLGGKYEVKALEIFRNISYVIGDLPQEQRAVFKKSIELLEKTNENEITSLTLQVGDRELL
ncbi:hypothetical protein F5Y08DRAFT_297325 [Xylaria arbuscula]|nr:hypothetical protein F5Y08DRAFT_297325 [Xylaria arbuscula]